VVLDQALHDRAARYAALGEPVRLAIVEELAMSDRSPQELQVRFGLSSNLLAHHLDVLESAGLIVRGRSSGDGRRRYVQLVADALEDMTLGTRLARQPALFVCSKNSARSQLAAALWTAIVGEPATSAGTHPAAKVHPGAIAAAKRAGLDLSSATPRSIGEVRSRPTLTITVCDQAHEELSPTDSWLHWSITDPVIEGTRAAFDRVVDELRNRIRSVTAA
jgi:ArsR family transcriptional regulator, arsenate/arsenite/antimonite-responsive transcriptional repressor / arsenate reductase (thioredoxin)